MELLKKLAFQMTIGGLVGWFGASMTEKLGIPEPQGFLLILAGFVAWGYFVTKNEQKEQEDKVQELEVKVVEHIDHEVNRRCKEAEERAKRAEERYKKVVRQAQSLLNRRKETADRNSG